MLGNIPAASRGIAWQVSSHGYCDPGTNARTGQEQEVLKQ